MKIGIVGLPNVGKSSLFNLLTSAGAQVAGYPFCTIDSNTGMVEVPDERLERLAEVTSPEKMTPASIRIVDIAGLVEGASRGEGLGNQFLAHIREVDAVLHVVRCFSDSNVVTPGQKGDPVENVDIVETELMLADLHTLEKSVNKLDKIVRSGEKSRLLELETATRVTELIERGVIPGSQAFSKEEVRSIFDYHLLTVKPFIYVVNIGDEGGWDEKQKGVFYEFADSRGVTVVEINVKLEQELAEFPPDEAGEIRRQWGAHYSKPSRIIKECFDLLDLITFYTTKGTETRAWKVKRGTRVADAVGNIHSDFKDKFIRAEIVDSQHLIDAGSFQHARDQGCVKVEGRDYVLLDGEVVLVKI
jgi:hypothetical protein